MISASANNAGFSLIIDLTTPSSSASPTPTTEGDMRECLTNLANVHLAQRSTTQRYLATPIQQMAEPMIAMWSGLFVDHDCIFAAEDALMNYL